MTVKILEGDCRLIIPQMADSSLNCIVTSPPYFGLRDYGMGAQIGLETSPDDYVHRLVEVFRLAHNALRDDGTLWLNLGDSYAGNGSGGNGATGGRDKSTLQSPMPPVGTVPVKKNVPQGLKSKDLIGIPWRIAFALQADGWYLRDAIVWAKPNGMPGSQNDRCTSSYEMIFHFSKSARYWSDFDAIKTPPRESSQVRMAQDIQSQAGSHRVNGGGKTNGPMKAVRSDKQRGHSRRHAGFNERWDKMTREEQQSIPAMMRNVWFVSPGGYDEAHFAVMPDEIARRCILASCPEGGMVMDPFGGAGTTGLVAARLGRSAALIELNPEYAAMARKRIHDDAPLFAEVEA